MSDIKILVATHKEYTMPNDEMYLPIHVGREGKEDIGFQGDNTGDHISHKNNNYCELTGLYWAWKNLDCKYIGLTHYRRYFSSESFINRFINRKNKLNLILKKNELESLLTTNRIILPLQRNYFIETVQSHYQNAHNIKDLEETEKIIREKFPDYIDSFNLVMKSKKIHLYNMFIMKKSDFDSYCEWVFDILFELEKRSDITDYDDYQKRLYGFVSERLLNVWVYNNISSIKEIPVINMEKIKWGDKIYNFIIRKVK